jgi:hypothetical protein
MASDKYNALVPRYMYWSNELKNVGRCLKCNSLLEKEYHLYLLLIKTKDGIYENIIGTDSGSFCPNCPIIVLDYYDIRDMASMADFSMISFTVLGTIDENDMKIVAFINFADKPSNKDFVNYINEDNYSMR